MAVLVLNGGSSSWKSALFEGVAADAVPGAGTTVDAGATVALAWRGNDGSARLEASLRDGTTFARDVKVERGGAAVPVLLAAYRELGREPNGFAAVGHRIVHGGARFRASVRLDDASLAALRDLEPLAPRHNPLELAGIAAVSSALPDVPQMAAFDTAFHRTLPPPAYVYGGPYEWLARDVRRYGFHGLSVAYCLERSAALLGRDIRDLQLIVAHLGSGCSATAVRDGASVDTSMGFTPLDGVVMGTRSGAVDPGILTYLLRAMPERSAPEAGRALDDELNARSGLLGLSGVSSDVRDLELAAHDGNARAQLALDVFTHRLAAGIAALLPALARLDALVLTGGIGENAAALRARLCERLAFAGIVLDAERNASRRSDADVAAPASAVRVLVLQAREEWYVAREWARLRDGGHY